MTLTLHFMIYHRDWQSRVATMFFNQESKIPKWAMAHDLLPLFNLVFFYSMLLVSKNVAKKSTLKYP